MKNSNYIINGILLVAVIVLFILQFTGKGTSAKSPETAFLSSDSTEFHLPLAYIKTDSLLLNYNFCKDLNDALLKKMEDKKLSIRQKEEKWRKNAIDFQEKLDRNVFYSRERALEAQNALAKEQQDLENFAAQIEQEMGLEQMRMNKQLFDTITTVLKLYNTPKKYEMIFSNDNILYSDDLYDITVDITEFLNARYVPEKK